MNRPNESERPPVNDLMQQAHLASGMIQGQQVINEQPISQRTAELTGRDSGPTPAPGQLGYKASKIEDISIQQLDRGFIVKVGCQTLAIGSAGELIGKLNAYIMNPDKTRELYFSGFF